MCLELAPPVESWRACVKLQPPYYIKDEASITVLKSDKSKTCFVLCKLENQSETQVHKKARVVNFDNIAPQPEGGNGGQAE